jgi:hypothetical protein
MLMGSRTLHSSLICHTVDVRWVLMVIPYILFKMLDLDGSDLPKVFNPVQVTVIVAVVPTEAGLDFSPEKLSAEAMACFSLPSISSILTVLRWSERS